MNKIEVIDEKGLKVAIQGYEGSFHHMAAEKYYHQHIDLAPMASFNQLVAAITLDKSVDKALMAIENSIAGSILPNYQLLRKSSLFIIGEIYLQIQQNLLTLPGSQLIHLEEVYSHPMAILQCESFFEKYPHIRLIETEDTALSARNIKKSGNVKHGAIASSLAARLYNLEILTESIETVKNNFTRFLVLSREPASVHDANKATINFQLSNTPGALLNALQVINDFGLNVSKIQSIPEVAREWRYYFHLDLEFTNREDLDHTLESLQSVTNELRVFGIYKKGETVCSN